jgi:predicted Zn-dependent peptidase
MKTITYILSLFIALSNIAQAQVDRSKAPQPAPAPKVEVGNYTRFELENGLKVFVVENHRLPKVNVSLSFIFDPTLEKENTGIGELTGDLIGTGTKTRSKDQINDAIDYMGASLSSNSSGITASSLSKFNAQVMEIMADVAINSVFSQEELDKKKTQRISALSADKDDPKAIAKNVFPSIIFGKNHPYGEFETEASIKNITLDMCQTYYQTYFAPNIAYLTIVGDITPAEARKQVEKYFSGWAKSKATNPAYDQPQPFKTPKVALVDRQQSVQSVIRIGCAVDLKPNNPDYIKAQVTNTILGGVFCRLDDNLREKHGFTYGARSNIISLPLTGYFVASTSARNAVTDSSIEQMLYEMKRMRTEPVPAEELQQVKNFVSGTFALSLENPQTVASFAANIERYNLPKDYYSNYLKNVEAVTSADVQATALKYILPTNSVIFVVGKASDIANKLKQFSPAGEIEYYDINGNRCEAPAKATIPDGVDAESVLKKYIEAIGGEAKIRTIRDLKIIGKTSVNAMPLKINVLYKIPDKYMLDATMAGKSLQKMLVNGNKGRMEGVMGSRAFAPREIEQLKVQGSAFPELTYAESGYKIKFKGQIKLNGKETYQVDYISPTNTIISMFYQIDNGLKVKMSEGDGEAAQITNYADYAAVNGVQLPKKLSQTMGQYTFDVDVESIEVNKGIEDKVFE